MIRDKEVSTFTFFLCRGSVIHWFKTHSVSETVKILSWRVSPRPCVAALVNALCSCRGHPGGKAMTTSMCLNFCRAFSPPRCSNRGEFLFSRTNWRTALKKSSINLSGVIPKRSAVASKFLRNWRASGLDDVRKPSFQCSTRKLGSKQSSVWKLVAWWPHLTSSPMSLYINAVGTMLESYLSNPGKCDRRMICSLGSLNIRTWPWSSEICSTSSTATLKLVVPGSMPNTRMGSLVELAGAFSDWEAIWNDWRSGERKDERGSDSLERRHQCIRKNAVRPSRDGGGWWLMVGGNSCLSKIFLIGRVAWWWCCWSCCCWWFWWWRWRCLDFAVF